MCDVQPVVSRTIVRDVAKRLDADGGVLGETTFGLEERRVGPCEARKKPRGRALDKPDVLERYRRPRRVGVEALEGIPEVTSDSDLS